MSNERQLPQYQSHKKVHALRIAQLDHTGTQEQESDGSLLMTPAEDGYAQIKLDAAYVSKHRPQVGGFYVVYEDGYKSFSPAKPFLEGYSKIGA